MSNTVKDEFLEPAGWYLTDYKLVINTKTHTGSFMGGDTYTDLLDISDAEGIKTEELASDLENDIMDSPASYIASGDVFKANNFSNVVVATTDVWGVPNVHAYVKSDGFNSEITNASGSSWLGATEPITISSKNAFPIGTNGQKFESDQFGIVDSYFLRNFLRYFKGVFSIYILNTFSK
jgi:hypothetical protein